MVQLQMFKTVKVLILSSQTVYDFDLLLSHKRFFFIYSNRSYIDSVRCLCNAVNMRELIVRAQIWLHILHELVHLHIVNQCLLFNCQEKHAGKQTNRRVAFN